jgi:hypothetical protein
LWKPRSKPDLRRRCGARRLNKTVPVAATRRQRECGTEAKTGALGGTKKGEEGAASDAVAPAEKTRDDTRLHAVWQGAPARRLSLSAQGGAAARSRPPSRLTHRNHAQSQQQTKEEATRQDYTAARKHPKHMPSNNERSNGGSNKVKGCQDVRENVEDAAKKQSRKKTWARQGEGQESQMKKGQCRCMKKKGERMLELGAGVDSRLDEAGSE